jgi:hypothetical protein
MAVSTRPTFERIRWRVRKITPINVSAVIAKITARVEGAVIGYPNTRLKSVKPLLPPKPVSLRKNSSMKAKVIAWVMMEKYTPLMRERKAKKPNTSANRPGTRTTSAALHRKYSDPVQNQGRPSSPGTP